MTFPRVLCLLQTASLIQLSEAWSPARLDLGRGSWSALSMAEAERDSFDGVQLTTKTNKQIVFDDNNGRFFETSLEPEVPYSTTVINPSTTSYEVPANVAMSRSYLGNEMMPPSVLFGREPELAEFDINEVVESLEVFHDTEPKMLSSSDTPRNEAIVPISATYSSVEQCYDAWNNRDMAALVDCFDDRLEYQDSQYLGTINTKAALKQHFDNQAKLLPSNSKLVLENIAVDSNNGNIGTQWHVQVGDSKVPFTRGCSFYQTNPETDLIKSGFRVSEMIVKPSKQSADRLVSSVSRLSRQSTPAQATESTTTPAASSIIEEYFNAWNRRDMEWALDCFVDDCTYQTEDPVFVDTFRGKAALRAHLERNAASLPSSCRILLDRTAVDPTRNTIATQWHLEVNGISIPNLRGCSMYTTDAATGLLNSGYDVTEAPLKIPRQFLAPTQLLRLPATLLFGQP